MDFFEKTLFLYHIGLTDRINTAKQAEKRIEQGEHDPLLYALSDSNDLNDTEFSELTASYLAQSTGRDISPNGLATILYSYLQQGKVMQSDAYKMMEIILEKAEDSPEDSYYIGNLSILATANEMVHPIDMTRLLNKAWPQSGYPDNWTHMVGRESDIEDIQNSQYKDSEDIDNSKEAKISLIVNDIRNDAIKFVSNIKSSN